MSGFDGGLDSPVGAAGIAHGGEAAIEHGAQSRRCARRDQGQRHRFHEANIDLAVDGVHVAVDQSRHQRALAAVDDIGLGCLDRRLAEFLDRVAFGKQLVPAAQFAERGFEQFEIPEQDLPRHHCSRFLWKRPPFMMTKRCCPCS